MHFFFDAYALIEVIRGNASYSRFKEETVITSAPQVSEAFYYALRTGQTSEFKLALQKMRPELLGATLQDWEEAASMKFAYKSKRLSLIDCLGYGLARKNYLKFLTGDKEFEVMANVEFVK